MGPETAKKCHRSAVVVLIPLLLVSGCATAPFGNSSTAKTESADTVCQVPEDLSAASTPSTYTRELTSSAPVFGPASADLKSAGADGHPDIWARIRAGFAMKRLDGKLVTAHERWFVSNPEYMDKKMERAKLYLHYIVEEVEKRGMPTEIALLPAIESAYQPYAYSRARAVGLWQFIAPTGRLYGLKMNWWYDGRRDVMESTRAALDYLEKLYNEFDGDWHLALAAYNAGEGAIGRAVRRNRAANKPTDYESLKLPRETVNYVPKLIAMINIVENPEKYGLTLAAIPNRPYFARVETDAQIDLGVVAKLVDMPINELQVINPGYTRWATDPDGPHYLLVPADKKETLEQGLTDLPKGDRVQYRHHTVARGETLHTIAKKYSVETDAVRTANHLSGTLLRAGQDLLIPFSSRALSPSQGAPATVRVSAPPKPGTGTPVIHRVTAGETLWSIARRYNVLVEQIRQWNLLEPSDVLKLGQRLRIFPAGRPSAGQRDLEPASRANS